MVFPPRCPVCHDIIRGKGLTCNECVSKLKMVEDPYCMRCGKQLKIREKKYCKLCENNKMFFKEGRAVFVYDEIMRKSIYRFKYGGRREYAEFYAHQIYTKYESKIKRWKPEVIIPIPLHKSKLKKRGYNQAALIAKELSNLTKIPVDEKILVRTKKTEKQKNLGALERNSNLKNAFKIRSNRVQYLSAMLIDDIYTTGATMNNASMVLRENGIEEIYLISLSIGIDV